MERFYFRQRGLITICGSTATGKSGLALALAQRLGSAIISADSRQVYREFDIGTAKPSATEQQQVPHYLIDICEPTETMTLADYQLQAQSLIAQFHQSVSQEGRFIEAIGEIEASRVKLVPTTSLPLLVGGTGLYIRSVVQGLKICDRNLPLSVKPNSMLSYNKLTQLLPKRFTPMTK
jgi:tRNA dimethylallyltransferase